MPYLLSVEVEGVQFPAKGDDVAGLQLADRAFGKDGPDSSVVADPDDYLVAVLRLGLEIAVLVGLGHERT